MSITKNNLKIYVDDFFDNLQLFDDFHNGHMYKDLLKAGIDVFLKRETSYNAFEIYQTFFMIYQIIDEDKSEDTAVDSKVIAEPNILLNLVKIMKKYEENTGDLIDKQRDHFIHSVNVFLLGLAIYSQNNTYKSIFKEYVLNSPYKKFYRFEDETGIDRFSDEEFLYRWGIASLFHDIGYPVEIIGKQLKKFMNDGVKLISNDYKIDPAIDFKDFNEFNSIVEIDSDFGSKFEETYPEVNFIDLFKPTDIIAHKISKDFPKIDAKKLISHLDSFVDIMADNGFIDHGFFSAILVLNTYGYLIQKHSKNQDFFFYPIVDSGSAILLHNYYRNILQKAPFNVGKLDPETSPLTYLLILCDELQEWNRQPFGVKDKKRSHINELLIEINDDVMNVNYIVKSGSMGLGFSQSKKDLIKSMLNTEKLFKNDLNVSTDVNQDNVMREIVKSEVQSPDILSRNVEKLAFQIHNQYIETTKSKYQEKIANGEEIDENFQKKFDELCHFSQLEPHLKIANIRQARSIPKKLRMIGCEIVHKNDPREAVIEFSPSEIRDLAVMEHDDWCEEKKGSGWAYGDVKDVDNLITPYLIPWEELPEDVQQYDIDPVLNIPKYVDLIGLKIVRTKIRSLTIKMYEMHLKGGDGVKFENLPDYIKYSHYKQADFLVKMLGEIDYEIVSKGSEGEAIAEFNEDELEYLARREHEVWYKIKVNLGWQYGEKEDDKLLTNPNLVKWDDLSKKTKDSNLYTFEMLPTSCDEVGLKIIKK